MRDHGEVQARLAIHALVLIAGVGAGAGLVWTRTRPAADVASAPTSITSPATRSTSTTSTNSTTTTAAVILAPGAPAEPAGPGSVAVPIAPCGSDRVTMVVATTAAVVLPGQPVDTIVRQRNDGDQPCRWPGDVRFTWRDATGAQFEVARSDVQPLAVVWEAGQVLEQRASWDQRFSDGTSAAIGEASVTVSWGPAGEQANLANTPFVVVLGLPPVAPSG